MTLQGKGFFIWKIRDAEGGDPDAIANEAAKAGFSHVLIKIADAGSPVNLDSITRADLAGPVVAALKTRGIQAWGWHYVYGYDPLGEARIAAQRVQQLGLNGYVIDAEVEYKEPGKDVAARRFLDELKSRIPGVPIALSSFRFPSYHPQLPWQVFLDRCDYNMPQVYWEKAHNPAAQLQRCVTEFRAMSPFRPVIPTGAVYHNNGWAPTVEDEIEFLQAARLQGLSAANFFSWDEARRDLQPLWNAIAGYSWSGGNTPPPEDITAQLIAAMNARDTARIASLYTPDAVQVTAERTIMGNQAIAAWYGDLLATKLPGATFTLVGSPEISEGTRRFRWTANSATGCVNDGNDTLGVIGGKISYHYTYFTVTGK